MPEMDGIMLANQVNSRQNHLSVPVILMLSPLEKNGYQPNKNGHIKLLSKPVKLHELDKLLSSIFSRKVATEKLHTNIPEIKKITREATILVAEDDPVNMLLISEVLGKMGVTVLKANNGKEVIELLAYPHDPT